MRTMAIRWNDHLGLTCTGWTWVLVALLVAAWLVAPVLALRRGRGARQLVASPFGFFWVGFTVDFVFRFFLLWYDSVEFGNDTFRLADVPSRSVDRTLLLTLGYWSLALVGYLLWPGGGRGGALAGVRALAGDEAGRGRVLVLVGCTACIVAGSGVLPLPLALVTPISLLGRLWVVPAAFTWAEHWRHGRAALASPRARWLVLLPALVQFVLSPFREHLVPIAFVPLLTYVCVRGRLPRRAVAAGFAGVLGFLALGPLTDAYRSIRWGGHAVSSLRAGGATSEKDFEELPDPAWLVTVRRFHGLDSMLLTVDLVPAAFPFTGGSQLLVDAVVRGVVPRALLPGKAKSERGQEFARTIWSYDSDDPSEAAIAPSMPGDLYRAGGAPIVLAGALLWGLLLGLLDGWSGALAPGARAAVLVLFATQILPSVERDFAHCVATFVQTMLGLWVATALVRGVWAVWFAEPAWHPADEVRT